MKQLEESILNCISDLKNPGINDEFRKELIKSINQLKAIQKFY